MTTLLEQARQINSEREYPYYIQPKDGKFVARHNFYRNEPFHRSYSWPTTKEKYEAQDSNFPIFDTAAKAREYIQDTVIEERIIQDERNMEMWQIKRDSDIC